jgi:hypothetical protein
MQSWWHHLYCPSLVFRVTVNESDDDHELRAGTPKQFWIVGVDDAKNGKTKFGLVALVLPKDEGGK